ncbi:MAG TPA: TonB-dependent receptor [Polyangia bacterium]|jgi:TonB family protein
MNWRLRIAFRLALGIAFAVTAIARAARGDTPAAALTPPRLVTFVDGVCPEAAKARHAGETVNVELELTIDAAGAVTDVRVTTPVGEGFDEAAQAAARQFVFEPARRGAQAIPARIKYRYAFELPPAAPPPPTTGALEGRLLVRGNDEVARAGTVTLTSKDGQLTRTAATDRTGAFNFADLPPGSYHVKLTGTALTALSADEEIAAGELTSVTYRLTAAGPAVAADGALEYGATATIEAPARETTKRTLKAEELLNLAGTRGDPLRGIEYMPGVARSPQADFVIIRGSSPADSDVLLEGAPVFRLYHFGGLTSFVQPRLVERIDLYPGNFSARFGRKMGGIIDVGIRDPRTDGFHGLVDINVIDSSFLFEGPLTKHLSFAVAAKRSTIDFFFDKLVPRDEVQVLAAPVYWDYQAFVTYKPSDNDRFRAMVYGSYDDFKLILAHAEDADPAIRGNLSEYSGFQRGQLYWQHKYSAEVEHEVSVTGGPFGFGQAVGPGLVLDVPGYDGFLRAEWRARASKRLRLIAGVDAADLWTNAKYNGPHITQLDGDPSTFGPITGQTYLHFQRSYNFFRPGAYLEALWQPTERWTLVPGVRGDYLGDIQRWTFDPRLTSRYQLDDTTALKGGVGLFSQAPDFAEVLPVIGNPHLRAPRAQHYGLGVEKTLGDRLVVTLEGFYKRLSLLTVNSPVPGENLNNDGIGRIYGAETSARLRPTEKSTGFLSYTLSRSERRDHANEPWRLFNWDQTHILTVSGGYRLGHDWNLSGTFRYVTGNPLTPVVASVYNANTDTYKPIYGAVNSARSNAFHRLDVRIEKTWQIKTGRLAFYLDVQNAYNHQSDEGRVYNYNFTQSGTIPGLPVIPSLGLRGEI